MDEFFDIVKKGFDFPCHGAGGVRLHVVPGHGGGGLDRTPFPSNGSRQREPGNGWRGKSLQLVFPMPFAS